MARKPSAERREELLHIAAAEFAERGFPGATMRGIAARWGVQPAALYYWFPSKAKLLEAICHYAIGEFLQRMQAVLDLDAPVEEKVRRALRAHLEPLLEQRFYVHAFLFQRRDLPRGARRPLNALSHAYEALWRRLLEDAQRAGFLGGDVDLQVAVLAILGMCNSVVRWPRRSKDMTLDRVALAMTRLVLDGLSTGAPRKSKRKERKA